MRKVKNGYQVEPRNAKHYKGKVSLKTLYFVHEKGAVIDNGRAIIVIPPRPAVQKAYDRLIRKQKTELNKFKTAMFEYLNIGQKGKINDLIKNAKIGAGHSAFGD